MLAKVRWPAPIVESCLLRGVRSEDTPSLKMADRLATVSQFLWKRYSKKPIEDLEKPVKGTKRFNTPSHDATSTKLIIIRNKDNAAPNILLNIDRFSSPSELWTAAIIGVVLQIGVLVFSGFITYYHTLTSSFKNDGQPAIYYAYPCTVVGTALLVSGLLICSHVVESSTYENKYRPNGLEARLLYLQKSGTVSDQSFGSFAIFAKEPKSVITTSRRETVGPVLETKTVLGLVISLSGFVIQFVGLRSMHWSATVVQLGVTVTMTTLRALVRRDLANTAKSQPLSLGFELDWFATKLAVKFFSSPLGDHPDSDSYEKTTADSSSWLEKFRGGKTQDDGARSNATADDEARSWITKIISTSKTPDLEKPRASTAHAAMRLRKGLADLAPWPRPLSAEARAVATAIETTLDFLDSQSLSFKSRADSTSSEGTSTMGDSKGEPNRQATFEWHVETLHKGKVSFRVCKQRSGKWKASEAEIEAALSLWNYGTQPRQPGAKPGRTDQKSDKDPPGADSAPLPVLRLLGVNSARLRRDLRWWLPTDTTKVLAVGRVGEPAEEADGIHYVGYCRGVIGCGPSDCPPGWTETLPYRAMELKRPFDTRCRFTHPEVYLATTSEKPAILLFGQHLFTAFMWALVKKLEEPIRGRAHIQASDQSQVDSSTLSWQSFTLQNANLSILAQDIHATGLGSLEEVYICLVPPLSSAHRLPRADSVVDWTRQHSVQPGMKRRWSEVVDAFTWLLGTFPNTDPVATDAVPATVSLLLSLAHEYKTQKQQLYEEKVVEELKKLKTVLEAELGATGAAHLSLGIYAKHGPSWVDEVVDTIMLESPSHARPTCPYPIAMVSKDYHAKHGMADGAPASGFLGIKDANGRTELHYASMGNAYRKHRPGDSHKANAQDRLGWAPLHFAANLGGKRHTRSVISDLIQAGGDVDLRSQDGMTPLHCAAMVGSTGNMTELMNAEADANAADGLRNTALHWAAFAGHDEAVRYLLPLTSPTLRTSGGRTALHQAVLGGNFAALQSILGRGYEPDIKDQQGRTALHYAAIRGDGLAVSVIMEKFRESGADLHLEDRAGMRPADYAARGGFQEITTDLLWTGGDDQLLDARLQHRCKSWKTIFHYAASGKCATLLGFMLTDGHISPDETDFPGSTALHAAAVSGSLAAMNVLVAHGVDVWKDVGVYGTALHLAAEHGHRDCVEYLESRLREGPGRWPVTGSDKRTPLHFAAGAGHVSVMEFLLERGCPVDAQDGYRFTALHKAARNGKLDAARVLLENGCSIDLGNHQGLTALHEAAGSGDVAMVRLLLEWKARVDAPTLTGNEPLAHAAHRGRLAVVKLLVQHGARIDNASKRGGTAFLAAASCFLGESEYSMEYRDEDMESMERRVDVLRFLTESGVNPNAAGIWGDGAHAQGSPTSKFDGWYGCKRIPVRMFREAFSLAGPRSLDIPTGGKACGQ